MSRTYKTQSCLFCPKCRALKEVRVEGDIGRKYTRLYVCLVCSGKFTIIQSTTALKEVITVHARRT